MDTEDGPASRFGNDVAVGNAEETAAHVPESAGTGTGKKKRKTMHHTASEAHQVDAVLSLSWNRTARQMLVSGSMDRTVKLWDLSRDMKEGALRSFGEPRKARRRPCC